MPRIKDIVDEALEIVFKKLKVEPLMQESLMNTINLKAKNKVYYQRRINQVDPAEAALKRKISAEKSQQVKINLARFTEFEQTILRIVCKVNRINIEEFVKLCRKREYVEARFQFAAVLLIQFHYTYVKVGNLLVKDHSTIIHAIRQHVDFYELLTSYKVKYNQILNAVDEEFPGMMNTEVKSNVIVETLDSNRRRTRRKEIHEKISEYSR
jgi:chromosomal replication initiation ATPase DnaA